MCNTQWTLQSDPAWPWTYCFETSSRPLICKLYFNPPLHILRLSSLLRTMTEGEWLSHSRTEGLSSSEKVPSPRLCRVLPLDSLLRQNSHMPPAGRKPLRLPAADFVAHYRLPAVEVLAWVDQVSCALESLTDSSQKLPAPEQRRGRQLC